MAFMHFGDFLQGMRLSAQDIADREKAELNRRYMEEQMSTMELRRRMDEDELRDRSEVRRIRGEEASRASKTFDQEQTKRDVERLRSQATAALAVGDRASALKLYNQAQALQGLENPLAGTEFAAGADGSMELVRPGERPGAVITPRVRMTYDIAGGDRAQVDYEADDAAVTAVPKSITKVKDEKAAQKFAEELWGYRSPEELHKEKLELAAASRSVGSSPAPKFTLNSGRASAISNMKALSNDIATQQQKLKPLEKYLSGELAKKDPARAAEARQVADALKRMETQYEGLKAEVESAPYGYVTYGSGDVGIMGPDGTIRVAPIGAPGSAVAPRGAPSAAAPTGVPLPPPKKGGKSPWKTPVFESKKGEIYTMVRGATYYYDRRTDTWTGGGGTFPNVEVAPAATAQSGLQGIYAEIEASKTK